METSLYVANEKMQMVYGGVKGGRIYAEKFGSVDIPAGTVLNGVITNEELFCEAYRRLLVDCPDIRTKDLRLTIGSSQIFNKTVLAPKLPEQKMLEWIKGEFADMETGEEEMLYDYTILESSPEGDTAFLCAARRDLIEGYVNVLLDLGAEIACIDTALNSQIKLMHLLFEEGSKTYILLTMDGNNLTASLYLDGNYKLSNRSRILAERGSEGMSDEVERVVSNLIQFNTSEKTDKVISEIYVCGFRDDERFVKRNIEERFAIKVSRLEAEAEAGSSGFSLEEYLYAAGNLIIK